MTELPAGESGWSGPDRRFGARAVLAAAALVAVAVPFALLVLSVRERWAPLLAVDLATRDRLHSLALDHPLLVAILQVLSAVGTTPAYLVLFVPLAVWLLRRGRPRQAAFLLVALVGSAATNLAVKSLVGRARPVFEHPLARATGLSFPSGHAQAAVVAYAALLVVVLPLLAGAWRRVAVVLAAVMVLAIGFARVGLGVHYLTDVVGGYLLGGAWVAAMIALFRGWGGERSRPDAGPGSRPDG